MGFVCSLAVMAVFVFVVFVVIRWDPKMAFRMMEHSHHFFEPDEGEVPNASMEHRKGSVTKAHKITKRKHFSPLVSKQVAARQQFRCAICKRLFDDQLWDLDHIIPLFRGGSNDLSNIRAVCRGCHMQVSANQRAV